MNKNIAVIDTETNWHDAVMSIGIVVADGVTFEPVATKYYIFDPEYKTGGMYQSVLALPDKNMNIVSSRGAAMEAIKQWLEALSVDSIFAYNASFDKKHLCELNRMKWFDIMRIAAYRQYNKKIPADADCCLTGRLKRNYGVEPIFRLLSGDENYYEIHNALCDAVDELKIMKMLGLSVENYSVAQI